MSRSSKRPLDLITNGQTPMKRCKMAVVSHVGENSDASSALDACGSGCLLKELPQFLEADSYVDERSDESLILNFSVYGFQSEDWVQCVQQKMQKVIQSVNDVSLVPLNPPLKRGFEEMAAETRMQTYFQTMREKDAKWSQLPKNVLIQIFENYLFSVDDFAFFSLVCRSWHCAAAACDLGKFRGKWIHNQMPWLLLTDGNTDFDEDGYSKSDLVLPRVLNDIEEWQDDLEFMSGTISGGEELYTRCLWNLNTCERYNIKCPEGYGRVCWGSAYGWIVTAGSDGKMFMFNPLTKTRVSLPSFGTFHRRWDNEDEIRGNNFVKRAVVLKVADDAQSCVEDVENLRVVAFYSDDNAAIVKPGNRRWVEIEGERPRTDSPLMDVTYDSNIGLVFVDNVGGLFRCNVPEKEELLSLQRIRPPIENLKDQRGDYVGAYIVKCGADLLMILRIVQYSGGPNTSERAYYLKTGIDIHPYRTTAFEVYKYDYIDEEWDAVDDVKNVALFVGNNATMWVDGRTAGCKGNHIYFTDDVRTKYRDSEDRLGGHDCGIYWSKGFGKSYKKKLQTLYEGTTNRRSSYCCPLWFQPSINARKELK